MKRIYALLCAALVCAGGVVSAAEPAKDGDSSLPFAAAVKEHGKWGAVRADGSQIVPLKYDAVDLSLDKKDSRDQDLSSMEGRDNLIEVKSGKQYGFYDREGRSVIPVSYTARSAWVEDALAVQTEKNHIGFYRKDGKKLADTVYAEVSDFHDGFAIVKSDGKYGYIDREGQAIPPEYKSARYFKNGLAPVKDKKWGVVDAKGMMIVPYTYDDAGPYYSDGLLAVKKDNKWGFIDGTGKEVVPPTYRDVHPTFAEGLTAVQNDDKLWGFIDNTGKVTAAPQFKAVVTPFAEGLAGVITKDGKAYARPDGTIAFHADFDRIYTFDGGLAEYQVGELVERRRSPIGISIGWGWGWGGGWGWRHRHPWGWGWGWPMWGPWWYDDWYAPSRVDTEQKRGYINTEGKIVASASLDHVYPATKAGILVFNKNRFGWINKEGQYTLHTEYRALIPNVDEGFLMARNEAKDWGLVDFSGKVLMPFSYDEIKDLGDGYLSYKKDGKWGLLKKDGTLLTKALYDEIGAEGNGRLPAKAKGTWLYLDTEGKTAISLPKSIQSALPFKDGYAGVKENGKWGIIDVNGNWTVKPIYDAYTQL